VAYSTRVYVIKAYATRACVARVYAINIYNINVDVDKAYVKQLMRLDKMMFHYVFGIALIQRVFMKCNFFGPLLGTLLLLV
jgi:hypothetical protein